MVLGLLELQLAERAEPLILIEKVVSRRDEVGNYILARRTVHPRRTQLSGPGAQSANLAMPRSESFLPPWLSEVGFVKSRILSRKICVARR